MFVYFLEHKCHYCDMCGAQATPFEIDATNTKTGEAEKQMCYSYTAQIVHANFDRSDEYRAMVVFQVEPRQPEDMQSRDHDITDSTQGWEYLWTAYPDLYKAAAEVAEREGIEVPFTPELEVTDDADNEILSTPKIIGRKNLSGNN